jgi:hypothetical protein
MKAATLVLLTALLAGCSTHFTTLRPEGSAKQVIHSMPEEEAFRLAYSAMVTTMPDRKVTVLNGVARGYSTYTRVLLDTYSQQVLVFRAQGLDSAGRQVQGYYFEVSGSGSSGSGRATNVRMFEALQASARDMRNEIAVRDVATIPYIQATTWNPSAGDKFPTQAPSKQSQDETMSTIEKLKELRDRGTINESEFQAKKSELLNRL